MQVLSSRTLTIALATVGVMIGAGLALASVGTAPSLEVEFQEGSVTFCSDGGLFTIGSAEVALDEPGYDEASEAVAAFEAEKRRLL